MLPSSRPPRMLSDQTVENDAVAKREDTLEVYCSLFGKLRLTTMLPQKRCFRLKMFQRLCSCRFEEPLIWSRHDIKHRTDDAAAELEASRI